MILMPILFLSIKLVNMRLRGVEGLRQITGRLELRKRADYEIIKMMCCAFRRRKSNSEDERY